MKTNICYLVIDDTDERNLLDTAIREADVDFERIADHSLERARERFSREPDFHPSYIFIDFNMPLLNYIKGFRHLADVPVIVFTETLTINEIEMARQAGAAHCLLTTTHETALTIILNDLFAKKDAPFVLVYHPVEESRGFLR